MGFGYDKTEKKIQTLEGKTFSEASLLRELDRISPEARWDITNTRRSLCLSACVDGMMIILHLKKSDRARNYTVKKVCLSKYADTQMSTVGRRF